MEQTNPRTLRDQLYDDLKHQIQSGVLPAGHQVPTNRALQQQYGLSHHTVRAAVEMLEHEGLVSQPRGRHGRSVLNMRRLRWSLAGFEGGSRRDNTTLGHDEWAADVAEQGGNPHQTVQASVETAQPDVARDLDLDPGDRVAVRRRVRYVDNVAHQVSVSFFPMHIAADTPLMQDGDVVMPGGVLAHIGHPQVSVRDVIVSRNSTSGEASVLQITPGSPVLEVRRTGFGADGDPVRVMVTVCPSDRQIIQYELEVS